MSIHTKLPKLESKKGARDGKERRWGKWREGEDLRQTVKGKTQKEKAD